MVWVLNVVCSSYIIANSQRPTPTVESSRVGQCALSVTVCVADESASTTSASMPLSTIAWKHLEVFTAIRNTVLYLLQPLQEDLGCPSLPNRSGLAFFTLSKIGLDMSVRPVHVTNHFILQQSSSDVSFICPYKTRLSTSLMTSAYIKGSVQMTGRRYEHHKLD